MEINILSAKSGHLFVTIIDIMDEIDISRFPEEDLSRGEGTGPLRTSLILSIIAFDTLVFYLCHFIPLWILTVYEYKLQKKFKVVFQSGTKIRI